MSESILFKHSIEFLAVANEFVKFCETDAVEIKNSENFIDIASKLLSLLYLKALFLESPKNIEDIELEYNFEFVDAMRYEAVKSEVANVLGDFDVYVPLRDASIVSSQDYINISLSELLADVYQDIANFVEAYRIGENNLMLQASYYCIENFASYWGIRVLSLLDHFHRLKFTDSNI